jgi:hypothetical protein
MGERRKGERKRGCEGRGKIRERERKRREEDKGVGREWRGEERGSKGKGEGKKRERVREWAPKTYITLHGREKPMVIGDLGSVMD